MKRTSMHMTFVVLVLQIAALFKRVIEGGLRSTLQRA